MNKFIKSYNALVLLFASLFIFSPASMAGLIEYNSGSDEWSVTDWGVFDSVGSGEFAPNSFTGYTSTNGVAMLRNDDSTGWWIGDIQVSTYSSFFAGDELSISVTGATWGGIVDYFTTQSSGSNFYAAMNNSVDMIDLTGLSIGDSINGEFSWSGSVNNIQLNYSAANTSVPEPASLVLLGLGLAGIGLSRKKKIA